MAKKIVKCSTVAQPIGPYSLAVRSGNFIFVSGTVGWRPDGQVPADFREEALQMYENLKAVLKAAGAGLDDVVSTTTYLVNATDYRTLNEVRAQYFTTDPPSSAVVVVKELVRADLHVEVEVVAEAPAARAQAARAARGPRGRVPRRPTRRR
jgi:2-iminobutanoate/2-iminopropanoate deaminase